MTSPAPDPDLPPAADDPVFAGMFGPYRITDADRREVLGYRLSLAVVAISLLSLLLQWHLLGPAWLWPWLLSLSLGLGLALRWIHIYLRPLHRALQLFWLLGCLGMVILIARVGAAAALPTLAAQPLWILAVGPFFAALTGVGFKEFFCFRRPEAIGVTLLLPLALLGRLFGLLDPTQTGQLLTAAAGLLLLLTLRKFPMPAAADVGDKSVFEHLAGRRDAAAAEVA